MYSFDNLFMPVQQVFNKYLTLLILKYIKVHTANLILTILLSGDWYEI